MQPRVLISLHSPRVPAALASKAWAQFALGSPCGAPAVSRQLLDCAISAERDRQCRYLSTDLPPPPPPLAAALLF